jgi:homoserine O-acetyltransferase/O-succinyltransferase
LFDDSKRKEILMTDNSIGLVKTQYFSFAEPPEALQLQSGRHLAPVTLAYETYGALNKNKSNAIIVCHALSGDAHAAGFHEGEKAPGWWDDMIGPGKALDTNLYFIICSNVIGGCMGSTGPSSNDPDIGKPYALNFPVITIEDMVDAQKHLVDSFGIEKLLCVIGGSMGGMNVLQWASKYPEKIVAAIPVATALKHSPQQIAFDEVIRQSIMADPAWLGGSYYEHGQPEKGLAVARMIGHITFMSDQSMEEKFSRKLKNDNLSFQFIDDFEVEGYLRYRGYNFVKRFDANSYLYITKAMDYFDLSGEKFMPGVKKTNIRFLVISFKSDWLYPTHQSQEIVRLLKRKHAYTTYFDLNSTYGHDAFLIEIEDETRLIRNFLANLSQG